MKLVFVIVLTVTAVTVASAYAAVADFLISQPIGQYELEKPPRQKPVTKETRLKRKPFSPFSVYSTAGPLQAGHFNLDHDDVTYRAGYESADKKMAVTVFVTQHAAVDSDKWLLHDIESAYRDDDNSHNRLGLLSGAGVKIREIAGSKIIYWGLGGGSYTWISGQKVIKIKYTDLKRIKPEPIEVIQAYIQRHPSTIPATFVFGSSHDLQWIKTEMDRRLWLCDKWFGQVAPADPKLVDKLREVVKCMKVFLDYRERYFGVAANDEKWLLEGYLAQKDEKSLRLKLAEYKLWWNANESQPISF